MPFVLKFCQEVLNMPFEIVRNDIANMTADVIVNSADHFPAIGYGAESSIYKKAGKELLKYRKKIGTIGYGDAVISPAFGLSAKYVIHAVSPVYSPDDTDAEKKLRSCYEKSLRLAEENGCESIAFPLLGAGNNGFKKDVALSVAVGEISRFLMESEMMVYLVVYDKNSFALSETLFSSVRSFIDENYIEEKRASDVSFLRCLPKKEGGSIGRNAASSERIAYRGEDEESFCAPAEISASRSLDDMLSRLEETFSQSLIRIIDERGLKDPEVYKKANVDRKLFNKIKNNVDYRPSKITAIAFAIALELNLDETKDLLGRAGYALSRSSKSDVIIEYFITNKNYNIYEINEVLFMF